MNHLNEKLRVLRTQIQVEEMRPDIEKLKQLRKEEKQCLSQLLK